MSAAPLAIRAEGLWKTYRIHPPGTPRRLLHHPTFEFHALQDVNFDVPEGAVLGIVGHNGAGKSTLLKVLSRITDPSRGQVQVAGQVASLLEVGTGFHPELTGLENLYLNAAIHGLKRATIRRRLDAIVAFSEVGAFLNEPVKRYSSGMYLRLAFSIAAHLDPDILIVDEVLAVGDGAFQAKCLQRVDEMQHEGRTIVVVSHDMNIIRRVCKQVAWIDAGRLRMLGAAEHVIDCYTRSRTGPGGSWLESPRPNDRGLGVRLLLAGKDQPVARVPAWTGFLVEFSFRAPAGTSGQTALKIKQEGGLTVFCSIDTDRDGVALRHYAPGEWRVTCRIPGNFLSPGRYLLTIAAPGADAEAAIHEDVLAFDVTHEGSLASRDGRPGVLAPLLDWDHVRLVQGNERDATLNGGDQRP